MKKGLRFLLFLSILSAVSFFAGSMVFRFKNYYLELQAEAAVSQALKTYEASAETEEVLEEEKAEYIEQPKKTEEIMLENGYYCILTIPSLELTLPVLNIYSEANMKLMPCRYLGEANESLILVGHNYTQHFGRLNELKQADQVSLEIYDGSEYVYQVEAIEYLKSTDVKAMTDTNWDLTLFTCTYNEQELLTLRFNQIE